MIHDNCEHPPHFKDCLKCEAEDTNKVKTNYKIKSGRYKDFEVLWTSGGQVFPREGFYLQKSKGGEVIKIIYLEEAFKEIMEETKDKVIRLIEDI